MVGRLKKIIKVSGGRDMWYNKLFICSGGQPRVIKEKEPCRQSDSY